MIPDTDNAHSGNIMYFMLKADSQRLADEWRIRLWLLETIRAIECRMLGQLVIHVPEAIRKTGEEPWHDEGGVSGVALLSTSHAWIGPGVCALHTWPALTSRGKLAPWAGEARGCVDSCRPFDYQVACQPLLEIFQPTWLKIADNTDNLRSWVGKVVPCTEAQKKGIR